MCVGWDEQLLARYRAGCGDAFSELYGTYQPKLARWLRKFAGFQETWLRVSQSNTIPRNFRRWLFQIAFHNTLRARGGLIKALTDCDEDELWQHDNLADTATPEPLEGLIAAEDSSAITAAMAGLPLGLKLAIAQCLSGQAAADSAKALGLSRQGYARRVARAVDYLKKLAA
jgi:DNA-directed RNA polymerase specialized sigma24 family protein